MQGHDLIFFFQSKDYKFWQLDANGNVFLGPNAYPIDYSPDGWQDTGIQNILNKENWNIDRSVTIPFKHVEDAAKILKHIFINLGPETPVYLVICEQRLAWEPLPSAVLATLTGTNPFTAGTNTGTITGTPGDTVYAKVTFTGDPAQDFITGNIGAGIFVNTSVTGSVVYPIVLPASGVANYNIFFQNDSTTATAKVELSSSTGSTAPRYGFWYKKTVRTQVDLSTYEHDGPYVTCNNVEEGFAKHLKANENTVYEIPMTDVTIKDDGLDLGMTQPWSLLTNFIFDQNTFPFEIALPMGKLTSDGLAPYLAFFDQNLETFLTDNSPFKYAVQSSNFFCTQGSSSPAPITISFEGKLRVQITTQRTVRQFKLFLWKVPAGASATTPGIRTELWNTGLLTVGAIAEYDFSAIGPLVLNAGDRLFLSWDRNPTASNADLSDYQFAQGTTISAKFIGRYQTTYTRALRPQTIFTSLISQMSGGEYSAEICPYFGEAQHFDKVFRSGDHIRGIADAVFKISYAQFRSFWNTFDEVGISERPGKKIFFDRKANLINQVDVIDLGEIANPKITYDKDFPFNQLSIGYPDVKSEQGMVNGKNEFNTTFVFSLGTTLTPRTYEKISQVQAGCYPQEAIRIQQAHQDTTDNRSDNDPFVVHIERLITPGNGTDIPDHYKIDRSLNPFLHDVDSIDSIYNVSLSPKRCLLRSGDFIRSCFYKGDNKVLKFISADRNANMAYINGLDVVIEKDDVTLGDLAPAFFVPVTFTADVNPPDELIDDQDAIPGRCLQGSFNGSTYKFMSVKNGISPSSRQSQSFEMLSLATNDLSPLINFYGE